MNKLLIGDEVIITAGKSKGSKGKILSFSTKKDKHSNKVLDRVLVQGANMVSKHAKPNPMTNEPGGIKKIEAPVNISNVALLHHTTGERAKVAIKLNSETGKNARYYRGTDELIPSPVKA